MICEVQGIFNSMLDPGSPYVVLTRKSSLQLWRSLEKLTGILNTLVQVLWESERTFKNLCSWPSPCFICLLISCICFVSHLSKYIHYLNPV